MRDIQGIIVIRVYDAEERVGGVIILSSASESYFHGDYTITYSVELWP